LLLDTVVPYLGGWKREISRDAPTVPEVRIMGPL
jgi:hypothetical protein